MNQFQKFEQVTTRHRSSVFWTLTLFGLFVLWSNSFHAIAWLRRSLGAYELLLARFAPVGAFALAWGVSSGLRENLRLLARYPIRLLVLGLLQVPVYNLLLNWGQGQVPAGTASLLIAMNPLFTYLLALVIGQESHRIRKTIGLLVSFTGVYVLLVAQGRSFGAGYGLHALSVLGAPLSWATATVVCKPLVSRHSPMRITFLSLAIGSIPFLFIAPFDHSFREALGRFGLADWVAITHLGLMCTVVGFAVWYVALSHLPASSVAAFVLLNPPLTIAFGPIWGTDQPSLSLLGFGAWILAGVILSSYRFGDRVVRIGARAATEVLESARSTIHRSGS
ncbi:MAG: DMT family transporter [Candidatus Eisenbacteria bacterium]|nr:DMT family transporter [Candidatus Eisenbacteria bacterium]